MFLPSRTGTEVGGTIDSGSRGLSMKLLEITSSLPGIPLVVAIPGAIGLHPPAFRRAFMGFKARANRRLVVTRMQSMETQ